MLYKLFTCTRRRQSHWKRPLGWWNSRPHFGCSGATFYIMDRFYWVLNLLGLDRKRFTSIDKGLIESLIWKATSSGKSYRLDLSSCFTCPLCWYNLTPYFSSPGFLDIQLNGAYNFDFSVYEGDDEVYRQGLEMVAERIVETGITSYVILRLSPLKRLSFFFEFIDCCLPSSYAFLYSSKG